jgi:hypothetical protein
VAVVLVAALASGGCFLRLLFGSVAQRDSDFGIVFIATIGGTFGPTATCDIDRTDGTLVDCTYSFVDFASDLSFVSTSSAELIEEFGVLGLFIDPLIVQVPVGASNFVGTISDGSGPQAIPITEVASFEAQAGTTVFPEAGHKFVILDLPASLLAALASSPLAGPFTFQLEFQVPSLAAVDVKAMFTGKVEVGGHTYYPPMLPCTTDFASVPTIQIPVSGTPVNLLTPLIGTLRQNDPGCTGQVYDVRALAAAGGHHYLLYKTRPAADSPRLPAGVEVTLGDAFGEPRRVGVKKPLALGNPADKNGEDPGAPSAPDHLVAYRVGNVRGEPRHVPRIGLGVTDQFGQHLVDTKKLDRLLVPAAKSLSGPATPPADPAVDHFDCYRVRTTRGGPALPKGIRVAVTDQFGPGHVFELKKISRLCLPADKNGEAPDAPGHADHLMCYGVALAKKYCDVAPYPGCRSDADCGPGVACIARQPKVAKVPGVHLADQLLDQVVEAVKPQDLCVPALRQP